MIHSESVNCQFWFLDSLIRRSWILSSIQFFFLLLLLLFPSFIIFFCYSLLRVAFSGVFWKPSPNDVKCWYASSYKMFPSALKTFAGSLIGLIPTSLRFSISFYYYFFLLLIYGVLYSSSSLSPPPPLLWKSKYFSVIFCVWVIPCCQALPLVFFFFFLSISQPSQNDQPSLWFVEECESSFRFGVKEPTKSASLFPFLSFFPLGFCVCVCIIFFLMHSLSSCSQGLPLSEGVHVC